MRYVLLLAGFLGLSACAEPLPPPTDEASEPPACDLRAPGARDASWSPDGTHLVFDANHEGSRELYVMRADGRDLRRLTDTPASEYYPFFSPDGRRIVYFTAQDTTSVIYVMDADGGNVRRLTPEAGFNADPAWSPDGSQIAFYSRRDGNDELYVMDADGGNVRRLTHTEARENTPAWSPDGTRLAFVSDRAGQADLYVMNADGMQVRRLTDSPLSDRVARWAPDGTGLVFYSRPPTSEAVTAAHSWAQAEIEWIDADGSNRRALTDNQVLDQSPTLSPEGQRIAFTSCASGNREVYVMDRDGGNAQRLTFSDR